MESVGRLVRDGTAVGTAFVVTPDGLAATAAHVIGDRAGAVWTFEPLTVPGMSLPVDTALPSDPAGDVALVQLVGAGGGAEGGGTSWEPMALTSHLGAIPGDRVHLRGFAGSRAYDSGVGYYVGDASDDGRVWVKVSCKHAQPGMSGAPVLLTGTGCVVGIVSARVNAERWNRDTVLLARVEDLIALAPERLRLADRIRKLVNGTLRLSWDRQGARELILETDDFNVSLGRNSANRVYLPDPRDSRFHGHLALMGAVLLYHHLGSHPAYLTGATRQARILQGESHQVGDKDRLQFGSGTMLVEFSAPDLFDPNAKPTFPAPESQEPGDGF